MSLTALKAQVTEALDSLDDRDLRNVVEYVEFLKFRARRYPYDISPETAALYREFAEEDRALAEEGMATYESALQQEDQV